jgi:hypothetical protein
VRRDASVAVQGVEQRARLRDVVTRPARGVHHRVDAADRRRDPGTGLQVTDRAVRAGVPAQLVV